MTRWDLCQGYEGVSTKKIDTEKYLTEIQPFNDKNTQQNRKVGNSILYIGHL